MFKRLKTWLEERKARKELQPYTIQYYSSSFGFNDPKDPTCLECGKETPAKVVVGDKTLSLCNDHWGSHVLIRKHYKEALSEYQGNITISMDTSEQEGDKRQYTVAQLYENLEKIQRKETEARNEEIWSKGVWLTGIATDFYDNIDNLPNKEMEAIRQDLAATRGAVNVFKEFGDEHLLDRAYHLHEALIDSIEVVENEDGQKVLRRKK